MDVFKEFIVRKELSAREKVTMFLIMIASTALGLGLFIVLMFTVLRMFGLLIAAGCAYGGWRLVTRNFVEYEYIITNRDLDIDKIINQSARKRLCTIDLPKVTELGKYSEAIIAAENETLVKASANSLELEDYYLRFDHKSLGKCLLIFTPSEEIMEIIEQSVPRNVRKNV